MALNYARKTIDSLAMDSFSIHCREHFVLIRRDSRSKISSSIAKSRENVSSRRTEYLIDHHSFLLVSVWLRATLSNKKITVESIFFAVLRSSHFATVELFSEWIQYACQRSAMEGKRAIFLDCTCSLSSPSLGIPPVCSSVERCFKYANTAV